MHRAVDGAEFDVVSQAATRHLQRSAEQRNVLGSVPARRDDFAAAARDLVADRGSAARYGNNAAAADGRRGRQDRAVNSEATVRVFVQRALQDDQRAAAADCGTANHSAGGHLIRPPVQ